MNKFRVHVKFKTTQLRSFPLKSCLILLFSVAAVANAAGPEINCVEMKRFNVKLVGQAAALPESGRVIIVSLDLALIRWNLSAPPPQSLALADGQMQQREEQPSS